MTQRYRDAYVSVRVLLLSTEGDVHGHGWRGDWREPMLYSLHHATDQDGYPDLYAALRSNFTPDLRSSFATHDGDPAPFLGDLADSFAEMRQDGYPRLDYPGGPIPPDDDMELFHLRMEGWRFHGWALGYYTPSGPDKRLRRSLVAYERTGTAWAGERSRAGSLLLTEYPPGHPDRPAGPLHRALSRMVDAVAGGPVPLIPQEAPCPPEARRDAT